MSNLGRPRPRDIFALLAIIGFLHLLALEREYYWLLSWYDIMMHLLGGFWTVATIFWLRNEGLLPFTLNFSRALLATIAIGLAWEVYELAFGLTFTAKAGYLEDTMLDLMFDLSGALGAWWVIRNRNNELFRATQ